MYQEPQNLAELQSGVRNFCGDFNACNGVCVRSQPSLTYNWKPFLPSTENKTISASKWYFGVLLLHHVANIIRKLMFLGGR